MRRLSSIYKKLSRFLKWDSFQPVRKKDLIHAGSIQFFPVGSSDQSQSAWTRQIGGDHYKKFAIQPTEYILKNKLDFCEGNVVKYITRWRKKGGLEDLLKVKHYVDILIEAEYGERAPHIQNKR